jgi:2,4-dienoyl-CoA reductase (NADPH2)
MLQSVSRGLADVLLSPITINKMVIPNRILMPAMHLSMVDRSHVTDQLVAFYKERARGGAGAFVAGYGMVNEYAGSDIIIGAHRDEFIPGLRRLAEAMKLGGGRAGLQFNHSGRYNFSILLGGRQPVAPSAITSSFTKEQPRALERGEIEQTIQDFAAAAVRGREAGFDFVEILSGTGYLISQFLSDLTNQRTDEYGGSWENRMRFGLEIAQAVRKALGDDYPIIWRINGNDFMPHGIGRRRMEEYAIRLVGKGADAISVNVGWHEARVPQIVTQVPRGAFAYLSKGIKELVDVPVIAGHRINDVATASEMILDHMCDLVGMGRALIADPELPIKIAEGREKEIIHCVACAQGCFDHLFALKPVECLCNPCAGHEIERKTQETASPKRVLVVGGGAAGMTAAAAAARQGHEVVLYEQEKCLGGQLLLAGIPPGREEFIVLAEDLETQLASSGVSGIVRGVAVDEEVIDKERPDVVVLATGARQVIPSLPGVERPHVVGAWDVLLGRVSTGRKVVVIGGGAVGVETALFLAEKGTLSGDMVKFLLVNRAEPIEDLYDLATRGSKEVTLVEMLDRVGPDIGRSTRWGMLQDLDRYRVKVLSTTTAKEITSAGVIVENGTGMHELVADTVVLALGSRSYNPLEEIVASKGIPFHVIGDARSAGKAFDAIHDGYNTVREI